jgi:GNAT superfamily N-acetyltransferase
VIKTGFEVMDVDLIHSWLTSAYWCEGINRSNVERGMRNSSLLIGTFAKDGLQVGFARIISDRMRFAYVLDVFVAPEHRGQGIARQMSQFAFEEPDHRGIRQWLLATKDAHGVYERCGFNPLPNVDRWMSRLIKVDLSKPI